MAIPPYSFRELLNGEQPSGARLERELGGGDDVGVVLEEVVLLVEMGHPGRLGERTRKIGGHAGLFGDDEGFGHEGHKGIR